MTPNRLTPGKLYFSPTGRLCMYIAPQQNGISRSAHLFAYMTKNGKPSADEGFAISLDNVRAIAAMTEAGTKPPMTVPRYIGTRGLA